MYLILIVIYVTLYVMYWLKKIILFSPHILWIIIYIILKTNARLQHIFVYIIVYQQWRIFNFFSGGVHKILRITKYLLI